MLACVAGGCGETSDESGLVIELASEVSPLGSVDFTVLGDRGAIAIDQRISDGNDALAMPRRVRIAGGMREERVRVLAWGLQGTSRVAFGYTTAQLMIGSEDTASIVLAAPPGDCDGDSIPDPLDGCPAIADPTQADADADGITDACTPGAGCPANLFTNGDFEAGTGGWQASTVAPAVLSRVPGGHASDFAAQLCKVPNGGLYEYSMDDRPNTVLAPMPGGRYRADAWVRSDSVVAQMIDLRVGELSIPGENPITTMIASVPAMADWQLLSLTYTVTAAAGTSVIDSRLRVKDAPDGACFVFDDLCLQPLAPSCP